MEGGQSCHLCTQEENHYQGKNNFKKYFPAYSIQMQLILPIPHAKTSRNNNNIQQ